MTKISRFFVDYLMVPVTIVALSAALSAYHVSREVEGYDYATLCEAWPRLHQPTRDAIADAMKANDGKISRWCYATIFRLALNDAGALTAGTTSASLETERAALARQVFGH